MPEIYDVSVIGAGVIGCSIARELSKFSIKTIVIEKEADVSWGTTKGNSGVVHAGYAATPGSFKAKFNLLGNPMFDDICKELFVPFKRNGTWVVALDEDQVKSLEELQEKGKKNNVPTEIITDKEKILQMEPNLNPKVEAILLAPTGGIVSPYELTIALAENAFTNGVKFEFSSEVSSIEVHEDYFKISTTKGIIKTKNVVNAAGLYSDAIANMVGINDFTIRPRRGEYVLFEKDSVKIDHVLFPVPTKISKGILASPTMHGNVFAGPNAVNIDDKEDTGTYTEGIDEILSGARKLIPNLPMRKSITTFAGVRAVADTNDFIVGETKVDGFYNAAGIQSPGLTSAPAIGKYIAEMVVEKINAKPNPNFNPIRENPPVFFSKLSDQERDKLIRKNPDYAEIICRCELVTKAEIIDAIRRPLGATTLDGIKFRTRARMGRCQGGFCTFRIMNIMQKELDIKAEKITKKGRSSNLLIGETKDLRKGRLLP